jgi:hypothetical protein
MSYKTIYYCENIKNPNMKYYLYNKCKGWRIISIKRIKNEDLNW